MRRRLTWFFGIFLLLLVAAALMWLYRPLPQNPSYADLSLPAQQYSVEILRDEWGVPHISGQTDADASFGLAYAHAEDDYQTIQEVVAATRGVLASYRGMQAANTDYLVRFMDVWPTLAARYHDIPEQVKAIAEGYAAGLNLYAAQHPDETWRGLAPFSAQDVFAGFMFKTPFFYGFDKSLMALFDETRNVEIALAPSRTAMAWSLTPARGIELGSNALAVSAQRSSDGATRLLINSHQPLTGPVAWYEAHLMSEHGLNITGGVFPGTPLILHGFNLDLGWANTVNHIDLVDSYVLTRNPDDPLQYRLDEQWLDFEVQEVTLMVKLFGPFRYPAKRRILRSKHGPVIETDNHTVAVRYAGMGEVHHLEQYYRLNRSRSMAEFLQAMEMNALPSINYVYADKDGNIAFIHNAQYPNRVAGWDWTKDIPGDQSALIWQGYRPFSAVPKLINPESGLVFNSNNTPFTATDGPDNLRAENFPDSMGLSTEQTNRSLRLLELTDGHFPLSRDALLAIKFDTRYSLQSDAADIIQRILALDWSDSEKLTQAQAHLKAWDRATDIDNRHAALAITVVRRVIRSDNPKDRTPEVLRAAVDWSMDYLMRTFGRIDPSWGMVNRLLRGGTELPVSGGPDVLRAIYSYDEAPDGRPFATHGDSWIALVAWSPDGQQRADVIHQFGSATLDNESPHYADQAPLFVNQQWRQAVTDLDAVRAAATQVYRPQER